MHKGLQSIGLLLAENRMKTTSFVMALLVCVGLPFVMVKVLAASPKPECDIAGETEFAYLVSQWGPGYCSAEHCAVDPPTDRWTIHGLWPNYCQKGYPASCGGASFETESIQDLIPTMEKEWPSFSSSSSDTFWKHEFEKHGTCAIKYKEMDLEDEHDYFSTALKLHADTNLYSNLQSQGITPGGSYDFGDWQNALQGSLGVSGYLHCSGHNELIEIYLCYDQEFKLVSCSDLGNCQRHVAVDYLGSTNVQKAK